MSTLRLAPMITAIATFCAVSAIAEEKKPNAELSVVTVTPFIDFAYIPFGADLSSIKFAGIRMVKVAEQYKSDRDPGFCEEQMWHGEPAGSSSCAYFQPQTSSPAYEVNYSYRGQPLASDEYGNTRFVFSVYFRPEQLSDDVRRKLSEAKRARSEAAGWFEVTSAWPPARQVVVDDAASKFCSGNFVDGSWMPGDSTCEERIVSKTAALPPVWVTVRVDPAGASHALAGK